MPNQSEELRKISGFDKYFISNQGRVFSGEEASATVLKGGVNGWGYKHVSLRCNNRSKTAVVHRLVLEAFAGPCPDGMEACHNNGVKTDNRLENLRWDTRSANQLDKKIHGRENHIYGEAHYSAKLNKKKVRVIKWCCLLGISPTTLSKYFGVSPTCITKVRDNKSWRHVPNPIQYPQTRMNKLRTVFWIIVAIIIFAVVFWKSWYCGQFWFTPAAETPSICLMK